MVILKILLQFQLLEWKIATIYICLMWKTLLQFIFVRVKYCYNLYLLEWSIAAIYIC